MCLVSAHIVVSGLKRSSSAQGSGTLPVVNYDGIEATVNQWQDSFLPGRRGVRHLQEAIAAGLRGADLIPALLQDCRAYMFMRLNMCVVSHTRVHAVLTKVVRKDIRSHQQRTALPRSPSIVLAATQLRLASETCRTNFSYRSCMTYLFPPFSR